jgi:hypothetical protein
MPQIPHKSNENAARDTDVTSAGSKSSRNEGLALHLNPFQPDWEV